MWRIFGFNPESRTLNCPKSLNSSVRKSKASPVRAAEATASEAPPQLGGKSARAHHAGFGVTVS